MKQKFVATDFITAAEGAERANPHLVPPIQTGPPKVDSVWWIDSDRAKRLFDIIGATLIILFFMPAFIVISALIGLLHGRPIFFKHRRIGRYNVAFPCLKFRTMHNDAELRLVICLAADAACRQEWTQVQKLRRDPRILGVGRLLRKSSLDELPQLINVLRGEMSLVGPRPIVSEEVEKYGTDFQTYTALRPGITGLWQVSGRNNTTYAKRVALDVSYAQERTMIGDLGILLRTVAVVVTGHGAY